MYWKQLLSVKRENHKSPTITDPVRSPFEMDFDRIIFSHPFRRLQDKTQVHPMPEYDFVHTRLTHSLEVSSVGRSFGKAIGHVILERHPDLKKTVNLHDFGGIVAAASLAHDIGNPPFGHSGEEALSDFFKHNTIGKSFQNKVKEKEWYDLIHFEGNAQGFRILNKKQYQGLRLTNATLAAFSKYPRESLIANPDKKRRSQKKFGFYQTEKEIFKSIAEEVGLIPLSHYNGDYSWSRHPLAFLVEAADDICYCIIDLEDGCRMGLVSYADTVELLATIAGDRFDKRKFEALDYNTEEKVGLLRALAINKVVEECIECFLDNEEEILRGTFDTSLTDQITIAPVLNEVSKVSFEKIYRSRKVLETEASGFEVLPGLLEVISLAATSSTLNSENQSGRDKSVYRLLPESTKRDIVGANGDVYLQLMAVLDFIGGMTDTDAISFYRKLKGMELPRG
ncbi:MAG: deoxyguanosinetriphosphate triphosphohydrolase [Cyclobacteriaceae bacterium]|nr:deoxyguanosinetriphosphate triphosphohydrolase [Cyclobacteriaceae bacterium]